VPVNPVVRYIETTSTRGHTGLPGRRIIHQHTARHSRKNSRPLTGSEVYLSIASGGNVIAVRSRPMMTVRAEGAC
jgi:hypothetical protein